MLYFFSEFIDNRTKKYTLKVSSGLENVFDQLPKIGR